MSDPRRVLLTGATGYIGGRLLRALEEKGTPVRCLTRRPQSLTPRVAEGTEVAKGDVLDFDSILRAMENISTAYYLVHSMGSSGGFEEEDRQAAENFAKAAARQGVSQIIYLGGLGNEEKDLSDHLRSRHEVGEIFRQGSVPCVEFRASIVIGSGSLSFEMVRSLVRKLPVMITPRWVSSRAQPIAIEDVLSYLLAAGERDFTEHKIYEIGGADEVSYKQIMREFADQRGLKRWMVPVPFVTPYLSSLWLGLVTPVYARVGRKLVSSLRNDTVVEDDSALKDFDIRPRGIREAIQRALVFEDREFAETRWSDALSAGGKQKSWGGVVLGSRVVDSRTKVVDCSPEEAFVPIRRIGGKTGWYYGDWLWRTRGFFDLLVGGVGMRRGRRNPENVLPGDALDFWRVEAIEANRMLRLCAEMKVPGRAWLQFEVGPVDEGTMIRQTAIFDPAGLFGLLYWYAMFPVHGFIFGGMLQGIANAATQELKRQEANTTT